jgi:hypothetical protein
MKCRRLPASDTKSSAKLAPVSQDSIPQVPLAQPCKFVTVSLVVARSPGHLISNVYAPGFARILV